jgi:hypothetical protein
LLRVFEIADGVWRWIKTRPPLDVIGFKQEATAREHGGRCLESDLALSFQPISSLCSRVVEIMYRNHYRQCLLKD